MPANFRRGPLRPQKFFRPWVDTVAPVTIVPAAANLILTTFAPTVSTPVVVRPANTSLILTGFAPTVTFTTNVQVTPVTAALVLTGFAPIVSTEKLAEGGPYIQEAGWHRRRPVVLQAIPAHEHIEPTVTEVELPAEPELVLVAIHSHAVAAALLAVGAIEEEQFAALLAA